MHAPFIEALSACVPLFALFQGLVTATALAKRDHLANVRLLRVLNVVKLFPHKVLLLLAFKDQIVQDLDR